MQHSRDLKPDNTLKSARGMSPHLHRRRVALKFHSQDRLGHCEPPERLSASNTPG